MSKSGTRGLEGWATGIGERREERGERREERGEREGVNTYHLG
jgi:hypothetical protein